MSSDVILVKDGVVDTVVRDSSDLGVFPPTDGDVFVVSSALNVCGGQLWDGQEATNPPDNIPPVRRLLPKSLVLARVKAEGGALLSNVYDIMYAPALEARDADPLEYAGP